MTVFRTFWHVVKKYKGTIILYTVMLIIFGGLNMASNDVNNNFTNSKPDISIVNKDKNGKVTKNLIEYLQKNAKIIEIDDTEEARDDALFYRDVNYIIYIPENYSADIMKGLNPKIDIKSTGDYNASLAEITLSRYIETQNIYAQKIHDENELINTINNIVNKTVSVKITSQLDTSKMNNVSRYFNFASYSIMAVIIFIICLVLSSFREKSINKKIIISSMNYKKHNRLILFSSFIYALIIWFLYIILGIILFGNILFTLRGLIYMINTLIFTFCSLTIAILISTIITNKNAVSGIVNVIALGSAFLCGAFIPTEWLSSSVLKIAHFLPTYWYINSNDLIANMELLTINNLIPVAINMIVLLIFSTIFIIINNMISKRKLVLS